LPEEEKKKMRSIPCSIIRGGTSKGVFLLARALPPAGPARDRIIKAIMGTPDHRQIDGIGGADILTSKVALISPPHHPKADVDYTFAQVGIGEDVVSYDGNCGNISAAVGPFAIEEGIVRAQDPQTLVRIYNTNINKIIRAYVPVENGRPRTEGDYRIAGVPGAGAKILLDFTETAGSLTGSLLPTGRPVDEVEVEGLGRLEISLLDLANPMAFVLAKDVGLTGTELPDALDRNKELIERLEAIRGVVAQILGFVKDWRDAFVQSPYVPFLAFVAPAMSFRTLGNGQYIQKEQIDLVARLVGFKKTHKAFPGTGAVCLAAASRTAGTVVWRTLTKEKRKKPLLRIGHPTGIMEIEIQTDQDGCLKHVAFGRTWRKIMQGQVFIRETT